MNSDNTIEVRLPLWALASFLLLTAAVAHRKGWLVKLPDLLLRCSTFLVSQAWLLWRRLARSPGKVATATTTTTTTASKAPTFLGLEGVLHKKRRNFPWTWGPLLVSLDNSDLLYFHGPERSSRPKRRIPLQSCTVKGPSKSGPERTIFRLCLSDRTLTFRADSPHEAVRWAEALRHNQHSFHAQRWRQRVVAGADAPLVQSNASQSS